MNIKLTNKATIKMRGYRNKIGYNIEIDGVVCGTITNTDANSRYYVAMDCDKEFQMVEFEGGITALPKHFEQLISENKLYTDMESSFKVRVAATEKDLVAARLKLVNLVEYVAELKDELDSIKFDQEAYYILNGDT